MRGRICFGPVKPHDWTYLDGLFTRLPLTNLSSSLIDIPGVWREAIPEPGHPRNYFITGPWFNFFAAEHGAKYGGAGSMAGSIAQDAFNDVLSPTAVVMPKLKKVRQHKKECGKPEGKLATSTSNGSSGLVKLTPDNVANLVAAKAGQLCVPTGVNIKSAKWFWWWVMRRLSAAQLRSVLSGLRFADGNEATADGGVIGTSSVHFRDQIIIAAIRAGYSSYFFLHKKAGDNCGINSEGVPIVAEHDQWRVSYSDSLQATTPKLKVSTDIKERLYEGRVWCVTAPTSEQLIYVRRVLERAKDGTVMKASRPVVVGNTHKAFHVGHMRNAALGDSMVRLFEQVGHPVVAANYFGDEGAHIAKCLW
jgi:hypothetical protein